MYVVQAKLPPCHTFPRKIPKLQASYLCISLQQILMKVHSFNKFDMINLSKAVFLGLCEKYKW